MDAISFSDEELDEGSKECDLSLVGYSLGKRPFNGALLDAIKKVWNLKGNMDLISLNEGFFLFKFSYEEDFNLAWMGVPWFLFGKYFILKKWSLDFTSTRDELDTIPVWAKIHDLPLCYWNPSGISKIASKIGIPLAVDSLTSKKSRLTYARIDVQIKNGNSIPDLIPIKVKNKEISLVVTYNWKPIACAHCNSFSHPPQSCPSNPFASTQAPYSCGRSTSRVPRHKNRAKGPPLELNNTISKPQIPTTLPPLNPPSPQTTPDPIFIPNLNSPNNADLPDH